MANTPAAGRIPAEMARAVVMITAEIDRCSDQHAVLVDGLDTRSSLMDELAGRIRGLEKAQALMLNAAVVSNGNGIS